MKLALRGYTLELGTKPRIMGILNVTPDSFWDGGRFATVECAVERAGRMAEDGADIIDIGGESTRPGCEPVSAEEEIRRIGPVVEHLVRSINVPVSIDTRRAVVAETMLELGAHMINDISGLSFDEAMPDVVKRYGVPVVIMHMRGTPENMQSFTDYDDVVLDVKKEISDRVASAERRGIDPESIVIDPGIGFSKTAGQCVDLIARLEEFVDIGKPVLLGPSRKSFMGKTLGQKPEDRLEATIACCVVGALKGASIVRVHDVASVSRALDMVAELTGQEGFRRAGVCS
ncbi:MAG: dihydropteroate synthase [Candidatus Eisenbacteria bacterium]